MQNCSDIEHHLDLHQPETEVSTTDDIYEGHIPSEFDLADTEEDSMGDSMSRRVGEGALGAAITSGEWIKALREEREADRAGTYPGSSPSGSRSTSTNTSRSKINPRTGRPTVATQNRAEVAHRQKAKKDRWGK